MRSRSFASATLSGCSLFEGGPVCGPVDGPVVLHTYTSPDPEPQRLLGVSTEKIYDCLHPLALDFDRESDQLRIEVVGIGTGEASYACPTMVGPAGGAVLLDLAVGTYALELAHLGREDEYRLTVREDTVEVETLRASVSRFEP